MTRTNEHGSTSTSTLYSVQCTVIQSLIGAHWNLSCRAEDNDARCLSGKINEQSRDPLSFVAPLMAKEGGRRETKRSLSGHGVNCRRESLIFNCCCLCDFICVWRPHEKYMISPFSLIFRLLWNLVAKKMYFNMKYYLQNPRYSLRDEIY